MRRQSSTQRSALRNTLLSNCYHPLPLAHKGIFIPGWSRVDIDADWLQQFARTARYANTGLRCDNLIAFDIDVTDEAYADTCEQLIEDLAGPTDLCRVGAWPKRLLLYRLEGEPIRSGRTGQYGNHLCELLAGHGRQFAAFGIHPGTSKPYRWDGSDPSNTPWHDLPAITGERAVAVLDALEDYLAGLGLERKRMAHMRGVSARNEYDLLPDTPVEVSGERTTWGAVRDRLTTDGEFGNLWRAEYDDWGDSDAVHFYRSTGAQAPCAHDFVRDTTHWESTYNADFAELLPPPPAPTDNAFVPDDMADMISNCVLLRDKTVRRIDNPLRAYPLDGFVRSMQHLQVRDPNPPPSNPNKMIPFTKVWERDPGTIRADYAEMRPDHPDEQIIMRGSERILNTYRGVDLPANGGSTAIFDAFIEHLLPKANEQALFLDWLAHKVAHPGARMHCMVMVTPTYGTGRGTLVQIMQRLFGVEYVNDVELSDLIGTGGQSAYNAYMADSLIVTVAEALEQSEHLSKWAARRMAYERIKSVCDPVSNRVHIRRKYGRNSTEQVFASLFISSNHTDALAIEPGDRRLIVLDNTETRLTDVAALREAIHDWKHDQRNIGALARALKERASVSEYDPVGEPPDTPAKRRMVEAGQSETDRLYDYFLESCDGDIATAAQWRQFAHRARAQFDIDLPQDMDRRDNALAAVIAQHGRRCEGLKSHALKVSGRSIRPWILREFGRWQGCRDVGAIRAEILKNGDPGGEIVQLPG